MSGREDDPLQRLMGDHEDALLLLGQKVLAEAQLRSELQQAYNKISELQQQEEGGDTDENT